MEEEKSDKEFSSLAPLGSSGSCTTGTHLDLDMTAGKIPWLVGRLESSSSSATLLMSSICNAVGWVGVCSVR